MTTPRTPARRLELALAVLLALLCSARSAIAAPPADIDIIDAKFGFCDALVPERWTPIELAISSQKAPFSGTLIVSYQQDASQSLRLVVPVATTPGAVTNAEVVVCVPEAIQSLTFEFIDDATQRTRRIEYQSGAMGGVDPNKRDLGSIDASGRRVVLVDAPRSLEEALSHRDPMAGLRQEDPVVGPWATVWRGHAYEQTLPLMWAAYDAADVVVIPGDLGLRGDNRIDPRAMDALMAWVKSGGSLVVLVEPAGEGWKRFLGQLPLVDIADKNTSDAAPRIKAILDGSVPGRDVLGGVWGKEEFKKAGGTIAAAASLQSRAIRLLPQGARRGWSVDYTPDSVKSSCNEGATGFVATGPVGFGMVTLIAFDPAQTPEVASTFAAARIWRDLLMPTLEREHDRRFNVGDNQRIYYSRYSSPSGCSTEVRSSIAQLLSDMTQVPHLGHAAFVVIVLVILVLAALVGPVDSIVLKKRGWRQHSWLTALLWIALASAASLIAPSFIRSGSNRLFRVAEYDAIVEPSGRVSLATREGITSILPGANEILRFADTADGSVHRGVSPLAAGADHSYSLSTLALLQGTTGEANLRGIVPLESSMRQWSVRAFMDEAPAAAVPSPLATLHVSATRGNPWRVSLKGLPADTQILSMALETPDGFWTLEHTSESDTWAATGLSSAGYPGTWNGQRPVDDIWQNDHDPLARLARPSNTFTLPFSVLRRDAISRALKADTAVCLYVHCASWPMDFTLSGARNTPAQGWKTQSQAILRLLIPVERPLVPANANPPADTPAKDPSQP